MIYSGSVICVPPSLPPGPPESTKSTSEAHQSSLQERRILVVDDERLLSETTAAILTRAGFKTMVAYDGFSALEKAAKFRPEFLLTDIMMPAMNGVQLAIALTKMSPGIKILLVSGQAGISDILEESRQQGFEFPLLAKPIHPLRLIESLNALKEN